MDRRKLVLLAGALIVAVVAALLARSLFADAAAPATARAEVATGPKVLVAQRALPVGTIITADAVGYQRWPRELIQDVYFLQGEAQVSALLGTVVRYPITAGEPVTRGALVAPGDRGFLAAALGPGMRAVTVPVTEKTGVGGFVFPGDRVDLVLTQTISGADEQSLKTSETIVRNLRVLATDQSAQNETVDGKTVVKAFKTVTLEVTPKIAEMVAVAQSIGTLSLSLRALADSDGELEQAIASGEVTIPDGLKPAEEEQFLRAATSRPSESGKTFVTGGDVSRFQRRTMPRRSPPPAAPPEPAPPPPPQMAAGPEASGGPAGDAAASAGPVVRVTRGKDVVVVPVGSR